MHDNPAEQSVSFHTDVMSGLVRMSGLAQIARIAGIRKEFVDAAFAI
jgi:hypothetical protein